MRYTNSEKGITIVALTITVIVLIILASISIEWGIDSIKQSEDSKLETELNMMQHAILETYTKNMVQSQVISQELPGERIDDYEKVQELVEDSITLEISDYNNIDEYSYYYKFNTEEDFSKIGVKNSKDTYIVNYKTGEVVNITTPKKSDGTLLYINN